jgi:DNA-binding NarL/FixJ family response regulator
MSEYLIADLSCGRVGSARAASIAPAFRPRDPVRPEPTLDALFAGPHLPELKKTSFVPGQPKRRSADRGHLPIIVIFKCILFRDCFVRCLKTLYAKYDFFAFASVADWMNSTEPRTRRPAVILFFLESGPFLREGDLQAIESMSEHTPVVAISEIEDIDWARSVIKRGARGYVPTTLPFTAGAEAVKFVLAGGVFVPASFLVPKFSERFANANTGVAFTKRQRTVVAAVCKGMTNKQIACKLGMSEHTVKVHLRHIMQRLNAPNRTAVAMLGRGLLEIS